MKINFLFILLLLSTNSYSQISLIGPATTNANWTTDLNLTETPTNSGIWTGNVNLTTDSLKFRANNDWSVNWGGESFPSGLLVWHGPNIGVDVSGNYNVEIDTALGVYNFSLQTDNAIVYISPDGNGDGSRNNPANIQFAFNNLVESGSLVRLGIGQYIIDHPLNINHNNVTIEGGFEYENNWVKTSDALLTEIIRSEENVEGQERQKRLVAISAIGVDNLRMQNFKVKVADAPLTGNYGISTYAIYLNGCSNYRFDKVFAEGGQASNGADGISGDAGISGLDGSGPSTSSPYPGGQGGNAVSSFFQGGQTIEGGLGGNQSTPTDVETIDQQQFSTPFEQMDSSVWQSFTVGKDGLLSKLRIHMQSGAPVHLRIYEGEGVDSTLLYDEFHDTGVDPSITTFHWLPLKNKVHMQEDGMYTFRLDSIDKASYALNNYSDGRSNFDIDADVTFTSYIMGEAEYGDQGNAYQVTEFDTFFIQNAFLPEDGGNFDTDTWQSFYATETGNLVRFDAFQIYGNPQNALLSIYKGADTTGTLLFQQYFDDPIISTHHKFFLNEEVFIERDSLYTVSLIGGYEWRHTNINRPELPDGSGWDHAFTVWTDNGLSRIGGPGGGGGGVTANTEIAAGGAGGAGAHFLNEFTTSQGFGAFPYEENSTQMSRDGANGMNGMTGQNGTLAQEGEYGDYYSCGLIGGHGKDGEGGAGGEGGGGPIDPTTASNFAGSGGGSGGEGGTGGTFGFSGGSSFAIYIVNDGGGGELVQCNALATTPGNGGAGGIGGNGGNGGTGGPGGMPINGDYNYYAGAGGNGGNGGAGGNGADGDNGESIDMHYDGPGLVYADFENLNAFTQHPIIKMEEALCSHTRYTFEGETIGDWSFDDIDFSDEERVHFGTADTTLSDVIFNAVDFPNFIVLKEFKNCPSGEIVFVDQDADGNNTGENWENALPSLADAIEFAHVCDNINTIYVAKGIYKPERMLHLDNTAFIGYRITKNLEIIGGFEGIESSPDERPMIDGKLDPAFATVLNGDLGNNDNDPDLDGILDSPFDASDPENLDNVFHIMVIEAQDTTSIDGLTFSAGQANGGIQDFNYGNFGGAIYQRGKENEFSGLLASNCRFIGNYATSRGGAIGNWGNTFLELQDCEFYSNATNDRAGAINHFIPDAGFSGKQLINKCIFQGNSAQYSAGAINYNSGDGVLSTTILQSLFSGNSAQDGSAVDYFSTAGLNAGTIINCTFSENENEGIRLNNGNVFMSNTILYGNGPANSAQIEAVSGGSTFQMNDCIIGGPIPGSALAINVVDIDPLFESTVDSMVSYPHLEGDFRIKDCSPAVDLGSNISLSFLTSDTLDLYDNPRYQIGPISETDMLARVDLGAYEVKNLIDFQASDSINDAEVYFDVVALDTDCGCFDEFENNGVVYAIKFGAEVIYESILYPSEMDSVFIDSIRIDAVGPDVERLYELTFKQNGPGILNCTRYNYGSTLPFQLPTLEITNQGRPDSIYLTWTNHSFLTSGFNIYRDGILIHTVAADNSLNSTYSYTDAFSFDAGSIVNGTVYTYTLETISDQYQALTGSPFLPETVQQTGTTHPVEFTASDDTFEDKVVLEWQDVSQFAESLLIKKENVVIAVLPKTATSFENINPIHGKIENYSLELINGEYTTLAVYDPGSTPSNGLISGFVLTASEKIPVRQAKIKLSWESAVNPMNTDSLIIITDHDGRFNFEGLFYDTEREYDIYVSKDGKTFIENNQVVTLSLQSSTQTEVTFLMNQDFTNSSTSLDIIQSFSITPLPTMDEVSHEINFTKEAQDTTYFNLYRNSQLIHQFNDSEQSAGSVTVNYSDLSGIPNKLYSYTIHAFRVQDSILIDTLIGLIDTFPAVSVVQNLSGNLNPIGTTDISWTHTSSNIEGFRLYRTYETSELIFEGNEFDFTDFEGRPGEATPYTITTYRTLDGVDYESEPSDSLFFTYPVLTPIDLTIDAPFNKDLLDLSFTVPAIYTSDYNYDGVLIRRSYNGEDKILKVLPKQVLPAGELISYFDRSGVPDRLYNYSVVPFKKSNNVDYFLSDVGIDINFPAVSFPIGLTSYSAVGHIKLDWDSPHTSDNYSGFVVYKDNPLDSIGYIPYGVTNTFTDYVYSPPVFLEEDYSVATERFVDGVRYLSNPVTVTAQPPTEDGNLAEYLANFTASRDNANHVKLCWEWTESSVQSPFIIRKEGFILDTLPFNARSYYDYDVPTGIDIVYSIEAIGFEGFNLNYQKIFALGYVPKFRSLSGRIYNDKSYAGIAGVRIDLMVEENSIPRLAAYTETDSSGYYSFTSIPYHQDSIPQIWSATAESSDNQFLQNPKSITIDSGSTETLYSIDFIDTLIRPEIGDEISEIVAFSAVSNIGEMAIELSWSPENANYTGFELYKGSTLIKDIIKGQNLSYLDTVGFPGILSSYSVRAYLDDGVERAYSLFARTASEYPKLEPIQNLTIEHQADKNWITLQWSHPYDSHDFYLIRRNGIPFHTVYTGDQLFAIDSTGVPGQSYQYSISAWKGAFESQIVDITYTYDLPTFIDEFQLTVPYDSILNNENHVLIEWEYQDGADGFIISRYTLNGSIKENEEVIARVQGDLRNYKDYSGIPLTLYHYEIIPYVIREGTEYQAYRRGQWSEFIEYPVLSPVIDLSIEDNAELGIKEVYFDYLYQGASGIEIYIDDSLFYDIQDFGIDNDTLEGPYLDERGIPLTVYHYKVRAYTYRYDSIYYSIFSDAHLPYPLPASPMDFKASDGDFANRVELSWKYNKEAVLDHFSLEYQEDGGPWLPLNLNIDKGQRNYIHHLPEQSSIYTPYLYRINAHNMQFLSEDVFDTGYQHSGRLVTEALDSLTELGISIDIDKEGDGSWAVAGSAGDGFAIYNLKEDGSWALDTVFTDSFMDVEPDDMFGRYVNISDKHIAVSAHLHDNDKGAVYTFKKENNSWTFREKLENPDTLNKKNFGYQMDMIDRPSETQDFLAILSKHIVDPLYLTGELYIYNFNGLTWNDTALRDTIDFGPFGQIWEDSIDVQDFTSFAISEEKLLIGYGNDFVFAPGLSYPAEDFYDYVNNEWVSYNNFVGNDNMPDIDIDGSVIATSDSHNNGEIYMSNETNGNDCTVIGSGGTNGQIGSFGHNVAIKGDRILAGWIDEDYIEPIEIDVDTDGSCSFLPAINDDAGDESQSFGRAVALSDRYYMVGSPGFDNGNGKVNFYLIGDLNPPENVTADDNAPGNVNITWIIPQGSSPDGYEVVRGGDFLAQVTGGATSYIDTDAVPGREYNYSVRSYINIPGDRRYSYSNSDLGSKAKNGTITGTLKTPSPASIPVEGATIKATAMVDGEYYTFETTTNNSGVYTFDALYYGESSSFQLIGDFLDHKIITESTLEDTLTVMLSINQSSATNQNFIDSTAYTISGQVLHNLIPECPYDSVFIYKITTINGMAFKDSTVTDEGGNYSFIYEPNMINLEEVKIEFPAYKLLNDEGDSLFYDFVAGVSDPLVSVDFDGFPYLTFPIQQVSELSTNIEINFIDQTNYNAYINTVNTCGDALNNSTWTMRVRSTDGCYEKRHSVDGDQTNVIEIPPKEVTLTLVDVEPKSEQNLVMLEYFINNPSRLDVYSLHRDSARFLLPNELIDRLTLNMEFHKVPEISPDLIFDSNLNFFCDDFNREIIVEAGEEYTIPIEVTEDFTPECEVTSGYLKIINNGALEDQLTILEYDETQGKFPDYKFIGGAPNPVVPHTWNLRIEYFSDANVFQAAYSKAIFVEGEIRLPGNDIITDADFDDEEIPIALYVLHDPPGDESYSEIVAGHQSTKSFTFEDSYGGYSGFYLNDFISVGGLGLGAGLDFKASDFDIDSRTFSVTTEITNSIKTSGANGSAQGITGREAGIIVGTGLVQQVGLVNRYEVVGCDSIKESRTIGETPIELKTRWTYTVAGIENLIEKYEKDIQDAKNGTYNYSESNSRELPKNELVDRLTVLKNNWEKVITYYDEEANPISYILKTDFKDENKFDQKGIDGLNDLNIEANNWRNKLNSYLNSNPQGDEFTQDAIDRYDNTATAIKALMEAAKFMEVNEFDRDEEDAYSQSILDDYTYTDTRFNDPDFAEEVLVENKSFTGLTSDTETVIQSTTLTKSSSYDFFIDYESYAELSFGQDLTTFVGLGAGVINKVFEFNITGGIQAGINYSTTETTTNETVNTTQTTTHLEDGDAVDEYSVTIFKSLELNSTPYYQMVGGKSSCPYEEKFTSIDDPKIQVLVDSIPSKSASLYFQDPDEAAVFDVTITNKSGSLQDRNIEVYLINSSNPNGAQVILGGDILSDNPRVYESEPYNVPRELTLTVERNQAYDYMDLLIGVRPDCPEANVADTISISVFFQSPCSPISIINPGDDWLINSIDDELVIGLRDYEPETPNFEKITLEYRKLGAGATGFDNGWSIIPYTNIYPTAKVNNPVLPDTLAAYNEEHYGPGQIPTYFMTWQPEEGNSSLFTDGEYQLRAVAECKEGPIQNFTYSNIVSGTMDRARLQMFGLPQPADGIWIPGDEISIAFNKNIDCTLFNDQSFIDDYMSLSVDGVEVPNANFVCFNNEIKITVPDMSIYDGQIMTASVDSVADVNGNIAFDLDGITRKISWDFLVTTSKAFWEEDAITVEIYDDESLTISTGLRNSELQTMLTGIDILQSASSETWLSVNPQQNFSINPGAVKPINLTFEGTAEGTYYDTLMVDNLPGSGLTPKLPIKLIIKKRPPYPPDWEVDGNQFPNAMTLVTNFKFGESGAISTDTMDQITVWVDNDIRGLGRIEKAGADTYVSYITIYGSASDQGKLLEYRVWDASTDTEYDAHIELDSVFYVENDFVGNTANPRLLVIDTLVDRARYIPLNDGYTWITLNSIESNMSVSNIFRDVDSLSTDDRILGQFGFTEYINDTIGWYSDSIVGIDTLFTDQTYMVYLHNGPDTIRMVGADAPQYTDVLSVGANWIGYPSQVPLPLENAIGVNDLTQVYQLRDKDESRLTDTMSMWTDGTLLEMIPNQGYKLLLGNAKVVTIPDSIPSESTNQQYEFQYSSIMADPLDPSTWNLDANEYAYLDVVPLVGRMQYGSNTITADNDKQIAAFINGELRGTGHILDIVALQDHLFTLFIGKDEIDAGTTVSMYYYDGDSVTDSLEISIDELIENDAGKYTYEDPFIWNLCIENLILTLDKSPLIGTYKANNLIIVENGVEVESNTTVILSAPEVRVSDQLNLDPDALLIIKPDGCNDE